MDGLNFKAQIHFFLGEKKKQPLHGSLKDKAVVNRLSGRNGENKHNGNKTKTLGSDRTRGCSPGAQVGGSQVSERR